MFFRWLPWKWFVDSAARRYGILNPLTLLARIRKFAEPSEVSEPLELIRAWVSFQARGAINTRAIQHNLDWVWPYWVERQFDPMDPSFVPRAHSATHINMTHRNWTAVGLPGCDQFALVDPRGLLTPLHDGWSVDAWLVDDNGNELIPSRMETCEQHLTLGDGLAVITHCKNEAGELRLHTETVLGKHGPEVVMTVSAAAGANPAHCVIALRPYNPEGVQFIEQLEAIPGKQGWRVNDEVDVVLDRPPERYLASTYEDGDVYHMLRQNTQTHPTRCDVGMATGAAMFPVEAETTAPITVRIPLPTPESHPRHTDAPKKAVLRSWEELCGKLPELDIPDERFSYLYHAAAQALLLLSPEVVYPGPYTYRRFWYRDACLMLHALTTLNHQDICLQAFDGVFRDHQTHSGFYESQEGEWDSNGEVLWLAGRALQLTGKPLSAKACESLKRGAEWIRRKRLCGDRTPHPGLLPPGYSAEHLGPNNYFYWDNFWGVAGLRAVAPVFRLAGDTEEAEACSNTADEYLASIWNSIANIPTSRARGAIPAAPGRRLDAGAIGSICADYPLHLVEPGNTRVLATVEFLLENCFVHGGFFQDMTHSGINAYLTLQLSQVLLRAGDPRHRDLLKCVADLASPTGQWPEAIHPATKGGCMGDGQHGWAAAEWILAIRGLFLREEHDQLVVGAGLLPEWLDSGEKLAFGPTPTAFGPVTVRISGDRKKRRLSIEAKWRDKPPEIRVAVPGYAGRILPAGESETVLEELAT
jgi:hypothetical protein